MRTLAALLLLLLAGCTDTAPDGAVDSDGDGHTDSAERAAGTDPEDASSVPKVVTREDGDVWPVWGALADAQIQPGASLGGYCTFNFLFEGPNGTGYIGTAAHCTDEVGERLELPGVGAIATVVYDSGSTEGVDFTLARLDDDKIGIAHPKMLGWDGPTGWMEPDDLAVGDIIQLHGYGLVLGQNDVTRDRQGVLVAWTDREYDVDMPAVNGDSGSPLMHESGKAFGIISRYGVADGVPSTDSGPLFPYIFEALAEAGYGDVRLATV